ncbi:WxL domain surface cell wall-binding [Pilibacter termitis]|uniref:WxL domain surface cell wall-binding n=1 Tax=Pilibacter termitis TaxID=263852 RepID=A0A1T4KCD9_9ENTE|nr:WxL domain-containing protein [Pilibacter termitis]SJZ39975.1 WxL domain surface cell wall-binding [Pilibacter termitis]
MKNIKLFSTLALAAVAFTTAANVSATMTGLTDGVIHFDEDNTNVTLPNEPANPDDPHPSNDSNKPDVFPGDVYPSNPTDGTEVDTTGDYPNVIVPGKKGALFLAEYPKEFNFGTHNISSVDVFGNVAKTYDQVGSSDYNQAVSVYDGRMDTNKWHVTGEFSAFDTGKLTGATITITNLTNASLTNQFVTGSTKLTNTGTYTLTSGGSAMELYYGDESAKGTNSVLFGKVAEMDGSNTKVALHVNGATLATGDHKATIKWTLSENARY